MAWIFRQLLNRKRNTEPRRIAYDVVCEQAQQAIAAGEPERALTCYERAIAADPTRATAYYKRANVLKDLGRHVAALADYDAAIEREPDFSYAYCNRGVVQQAMGRLERALSSYDQAIALDPADAIAHYNRAVLLQDLDRWDDALAAYDRALTIDPNYVDARFNRSLALLYCGDMQRGLPDFEWRWRRAERLGIGALRNFSQPIWRGEEVIEGRRLLLHAEAGLGDTLQFCRFATLAARRGAHVILEVQPSLVELLSTLQGVAHVVAAGARLPPFDLHCPIMSLPLAFQTTVATVPSCRGYLASNPAKVAHWRTRLNASNRPRVGLVWSGNLDKRADARRSVRLADWLPYLPREFDYYCVQKEVRAEDRATLSANPHIRQFSEDLKDFTDTAALCACLDLVISIDTSVAHLNAALGGKTWLMLMQVPDWRWLRERDDSPWYPTMTLYRQRKAGEWPEVFERIALALGREFQEDRDG